jgi:hypothetical protein
VSTSFDIAVVGAGAAGIAAAVSAARAGCSTLLLDRHAAAGGTGGFSGLTTLCGLFDDQGHYLNEGFAREFAEALAEAPPLRMGKAWVLPYRPERFRDLAADLLGSTPNLRARWNTPLTGAALDGSRIARLNDIPVGAVIDCSGSAEVAGAVGADCTPTDDSTQAPAILFPLRHVSRALKSPVDAAQVLLPLARAGLPPLSFQPSLEPSTLSVKFTGRADQVGDVIAFLRAHVSGFEKCESPLTEFTQAHRACRMIAGQYRLTGADVLAARKFPDAQARGAWPIEQWSADGVARYKYLPPGHHYDIPARSLRAARIDNLFMAGKTISADTDAIASARVMGCCLATGSAAGALAALALDSRHT